jgi:hypothetical protein
MNAMLPVRRCPSCGHGFVLMTSECPVCNEVRAGARCDAVQTPSKAPAWPVAAGIHALSGRVVMLGIAVLSLAFAAMN